MRKKEERCRVIMLKERAKWTLEEHAEVDEWEGRIIRSNPMRPMRERNANPGWQLWKGKEELQDVQRRREEGLEPKWSAVPLVPFDEMATADEVLVQLVHEMKKTDSGSERITMLHYWIKQEENEWIITGISVWKPGNKETYKMKLHTTQIYYEMTPWEVFRFKRLGPWTFRSRQRNMRVWFKPREESDLEWTCPRCERPHLCKDGCTVSLNSRHYGTIMEQQWVEEIVRCVQLRTQIRQKRPAPNRVNLYTQNSKNTSVAPRLRARTSDSNSRRLKPTYSAIAQNKIKVGVPSNTPQINELRSETKKSECTSSGLLGLAQAIPAATGIQALNEIWAPETMEIVKPGPEEVAVNREMESILDRFMVSSEVDQAMNEVIRWHEEEIMERSPQLGNTRRWPSINMLSWQTGTVQTLGIQKWNTKRSVWQSWAERLENCDCEAKVADPSVQARRKTIESYNIRKRS